jgi:hypothetical protein
VLKRMSKYTWSSLREADGLTQVQKATSNPQSRHSQLM